MRAIACEAAEGGQIVRLLAEAVCVEAPMGALTTLGGSNRSRRGPLRLADARRLVLEPGLHRRHLAGLRGPGRAVEDLQ